MQFPELSLFKGRAECLPIKQRDAKVCGWAAAQLGEAAMSLNWGREPSGTAVSSNGH